MRNARMTQVLKNESYETHPKVIFSIRRGKRACVHAKPFVF